MKVLVRRFSLVCDYAVYHVRLDIQFGIVIEITWGEVMEIGSFTLALVKSSIKTMLLLHQETQVFILIMAFLVGNKEKSLGTRMAH